MFLFCILEISVYVRTKGLSVSSENPTKRSHFFVEFQLLMKRLDSEWRFPPVWMPVTNWLPPKKSAPFKTLPGNLGKSTKLAFRTARDNFEQNLQWLSFCWELGPNWQFQAKSCKVCTHPLCTDLHGKIMFLTLQVWADLWAPRQWDIAWETFYLLGLKVLNCKTDRQLYRHVPSNAIFDV